MTNKIWINIPAEAFRKGLYDGITTVKALKEHGDFGVGEFAALGGELIARRGEFFKATADGKVRLAEDEESLAFAMISSFNPQTHYTPPAGLTFQTIQGYLTNLAPSLNTCYAFLIDGLFESISTIAMPVHEKPYPPFEEALKSRRTFQFSAIKGTLTAFYNPAFLGEIGVPGYHFHFVSDDLTGGGHVTSFTLSQGTIAVERIDELTLALPRDGGFPHTTDLARPAEIADGHAGCVGTRKK